MKLCYFLCLMLFPCYIRFSCSFFFFILQIPYVLLQQLRQHFRVSALLCIYKFSYLKAKKKKQKKLTFNTVPNNDCGALPIQSERIESVSVSERLRVFVCVSICSLAVSVCAVVAKRVGGRTAASQL